MKRVAWVLAVSISIVVVGLTCARLTFAQTPKKDVAVVDLTDKTKVLKEVLQGKYIFVHDEERMAKGEPCFYIYKYAADATGKPAIKDENLVLSFHCQHLERSKSPQIVLTYVMVPGQPDLFEIKEVQFAGSTAVHRLPNA
jgi:hypothetical protein